jgi:dTMP kinase
MTHKPSSKHGPKRGLFISIDGPSGVGKSTTIRHLAELLTCAGKIVHVTGEPSTGAIGVLARKLTDPA